MPKDQHTSVCRLIIVIICLLLASLVALLGVITWRPAIVLEAMIAQRVPGRETPPDPNGHWEYKPFVVIKGASLMIERHTLVLMPGVTLPPGLPPKEWDGMVVKWERKDYEVGKAEPAMGRRFLSSWTWTVERYIVPLWVFLVLFTIYPTIAFIRGPHRRHRRRKKGLCLKCGYNLTGNVSGVCPECGERIC